MLLLAGPVVGQARIEGRVTDMASGEGVADVHVFVSGSQAGAVTGPEGRFLLQGVPLGANRIVVSSVGYLSQAHDVVVRRPIRFELDFVLEARVVPLQEIVVTGERDPAWDAQLRRFERAFLGHEEQAEHIRILNPEVLTFRDRDGRLQATASAPLQIENRALGYHILYFLRVFDHKGRQTRQEGEALFSPLETDDDGEAVRWVEARKAAYLGSSRHFLRALFAGTTREAGFFMYTSETPRPPGQSTPYEVNRAAPFRTPQFALEPAGLTRSGPSARERYLAFDDYVEVVYTRDTETRAYRAWQGLPEPTLDEHQRSWLTLSRDSVLVDMDGSVINPYGVVYYGYMAFERLADVVPKEYRPGS
ncbi:MAG: carboxypeptidase-like regulatory domain-containing protein [Rhodothermales bacterium]|nr:carboxypeptidase-like regulatory domain-containing protein [Rhodothermales bacterium]MBO6778602.1 carboxypeptidase-like regulatory domain-containing protein [Rhodothermales bacterium]